jgi:hypothetical protein
MRRAQRFNLDLDEEPSQSDWAQHVEVCLREAREADAVLLYAQLDDRPHFGAIMEAAAALSNGKQCFLVSPWPWAFLRNHRRCRSFETMATAIRAIMAQAAGEQARLRCLQANAGALRDMYVYKTADVLIELGSCP